MKVINEKKSFAAIAMRGTGGSNNNNARARFPGPKKI